MRHHQPRDPEEPTLGDAALLSVGAVVYGALALLCLVGGVVYFAQGNDPWYIGPGAIALGLYLAWSHVLNPLVAMVMYLRHRSGHDS
jgi:hypothetical protein